MNSEKDNECHTPKDVDQKGQEPNMSRRSDEAERNRRFQSRRNQIWVIKEEVKIRGKGNSGKRPSLVPRKDGN